MDILPFRWPAAVVHLPVRQARRQTLLWQWLLGLPICGDLTYEFKRKGRKGRLYLKATRIRARLGDYGRPGIDALPPRLWRMQRKIYARRRAQLEIIERKLIEGRIYRPRPRRQWGNYARKA